MRSVPESHHPGVDGPGKQPNIVSRRDTRGVPRRDVVVKTVKTKGNSKKTAPVKKTGAPRKAARPVAKTGTKYEQPGAPWWKRVPAPPPRVAPSTSRLCLAWIARAPSSRPASSR